jgi:hypothetical protein
MEKMPPLVNASCSRSREGQAMYPLALQVKWLSPKLFVSIVPDGALRVSVGLGANRYIQGLRRSLGLTFHSLNPLAQEYGSIFTSDSLRLTAATLARE